MGEGGRNVLEPTSMSTLGTVVGRGITQTVLRSQVDLSTVLVDNLLEEGNVATLASLEDHRSYTHTSVNLPTTSPIKGTHHSLR